MPRAVLVLGLLVAAIVLAAGAAYLVSSPRPAPEPDEPERTTPPPPPPRPIGSEPAPLPPPPEEPAVDPDVQRRLVAWSQAVALLEAGDPLGALRIAADLREEDPSFVAEPARAEILVRIEDEAILALDRLAQEGHALAAQRMATELAGLLADPGRLDVLRGRHRILDQAVVRDRRRAEARLIARARTAEEKQVLRRHLERFGGRATSRPGRDPVIDRLRKDRATGTTAAAPPLPVPDVEEKEKRRLEQLEKLRQREAVGLLDHIAAGLAWLALHQGDDGRITEDSAAARCKALGHSPVCVRSRTDRYPVAATALATLALLDFRDQDVEGLFEPTLARAVAWLLSQQKKDGSFPAPRGYTHGIAVMALGQAAASSDRDDLRDAVRRGLAYLEKSAGPDGGHRYAPGQRGDLSVTGWVAQAVEAAGTAGVEAPAGLREGLDVFWPQVWLGEGHFMYTAGATARPTLDPVGMLTGMILERLEATEALRAAWKKQLLAERRAPRLYTLYYGVRVLLALDGRLNETWNGFVSQLAAGQQRKGPSAGAWRKGRGRLTGQRVLDSAFCLLTLEHSLYRR